MGRRVPESNRTARLCRPLPNRSVNAPRIFSVRTERHGCTDSGAPGAFTAVSGLRTFSVGFGSTMRVCGAQCDRPARPKDAK